MPREHPQASHQERIQFSVNFVAAAFLFLVTAAFVLWQNRQVAILWDLGYLLDTSWRISLGQLPYRDFPLVHPPLTFLVQAGLIHLFGRHSFVQQLYAAIIGGLAALLTWRLLLTILQPRPWARLSAFLLALPLVFLGIYGIYPHPIYDCDCAFAILLALWMWMRSQRPGSGILQHCLTGASLILPIFFKQNIGLPFALVAAVGLASVWLTQSLHARRLNPPENRPILTILAAMASTALAALLLLQATVGLQNYLRWTVHFAASRRLPGFAEMLSVYQQPALLWMLPCFLVAIFLLAKFPSKPWASVVAAALFSAPFVETLIFLLLNDDFDDRADSILALWPLILIAAAVVAILALRKGLTLARIFPFLILAAIHGTFLSQQLWGSTYSIWPLLILLIASLLATLPAPPWARPTLSAVISVSLLIAGGLYAVSHERLNYTDLNDGPVNQANLPALQGLSARGPYLANFEQLVLFAARDIPPQDPILLLPGEDPFYFATGRTPQFPVVIFDNTTDPYSPEQLLTEARTRHVRWIIWKTQMQSAAQPLPDPDRTLALIRQEFVLDQKLPGYDIYRRR
jgi:hypothetical protein